MVLSLISMSPALCNCCCRLLLSNTAIVS